MALAFLAISGWGAALAHHDEDHQGGGGGGGGGNGFPPGFHFNLNVIGKKTENPGAFSCPVGTNYLWKQDKDLVDQNGTKCYLDGAGDVIDPVCDDLVTVNGGACDAGEAVIGCTNTYVEDVVQVPAEAAPSSRNVIFNARFSPDNIAAPDESIFIEGGKRNGKNNAQCFDPDEDGICDLEVTDWCTEVFPGPDDDVADEARMFLPHSDTGYEVFARLTGKPSKKDEDIRSVAFFPDIESLLFNDCVAIDGEGNADGTEACNLLFLGTLNDSNGVDEIFRTCDGFEDPNCADGNTNGSKRGKGVKKAVDITALFKFTGHVCVHPEPDFYDSGINLTLSKDLDQETTRLAFCEIPWTDENDNGIFDGDDTIDGSGTCVPVPACCQDDREITESDGTTAEGSDGIYELCGYLSGTDDPTSGDVATVGVEGSCPSEFVNDEDLDCQGPFLDEFVFNISDLVNFLLGIDNKGGFVLQIRFIPVQS